MFLWFIPLSTTLISRFISSITLMITKSISVSILVITLISMLNILSIYSSVLHPYVFISTCSTEFVLIYLIALPVSIVFELGRFLSIFGKEAIFDLQKGILYNQFRFPLNGRVVILSVKNYVMYKQPNKKEKKKDPRQKKRKTKLVVLPCIVNFPQFIQV